VPKHRAFSYRNSGQKIDIAYTNNIHLAFIRPKDVAMPSSSDALPGQARKRRAPTGAAVAASRKAGPKSRVVNVRFEPDVLEIIQHAANDCGLSLSAYLTTSALTKAKREMLMSQRIMMSAEAFDALAARLDERVGPDARIGALLNRSFEWMDE
jgi:uncharacterized protein (DUF1778 family)